MHSLIHCGFCSNNIHRVCSEGYIFTSSHQYIVTSSLSFFSLLNKLDSRHFLKTFTYMQYANAVYLKIYLKMSAI